MCAPPASGQRGACISAAITHAYYPIGHEVALRQGFTQGLIRSESKSSLNLITPDRIQRGADVGGELEPRISHLSLSDLGGITTGWQEADFLKTFTHQQVIKLRFVGQHKVQRGLPDAPFLQIL